MYNGNTIVNETEFFFKKKFVGHTQVHGQQRRHVQWQHNSKRDRTAFFHWLKNPGLSRLPATEVSIFFLIKIKSKH